MKQETMMKTTELKTIQVICAWCKKLIGTQQISKNNDYTESHGICESCKKEVLG